MRFFCLQNPHRIDQLDPTVAKFATVQTAGARSVSREIEFYRLEVILAGGYRLYSPRGTQFRQWTTARLEEYLVKGFTRDDERTEELETIRGLL